MIIESKHICKNCNSSFTGNYCSHCGQGVIHRFTLSHIFHEMFHVYLHVDKGIIPFIKKLFLQPGIIAVEYIDGKRKIFNPFQYLFYSLILVTFLMVQTGLFEQLEGLYIDRNSGVSSKVQGRMAEFNLFIRKYANFITFLLLPVYAFFSWIYFKKRQHNYAEHIIIMVFVNSLVNTLSIIALSIFVIFSAGNLLAVVLPVLFMIISLSVSYRQIYHIGWLHSFLKGVLVYVSVSIALIFLTILIVFLISLIK